MPAVARKQASAVVSGISISPKYRLITLSLSETENAAHYSLSIHIGRKTGKLCQIGTVLQIDNGSLVTIRAIGKIGIIVKLTHHGFKHYRYYRHI